jgi:hypothetical protein
MSYTHEQEEIIARCAGDFFYFAENFLNFSPPPEYKSSPPPHNVHNYQRRLIEQIQSTRIVVARKFRQGGFSDIVAAFLLWVGMFRLDKAMMIIQQYDRMVIDAMSRLRRMIKGLPDWLQPKFTKANDHQLVFEETGSTLYMFSAVACCGRSLDYLIIDEAQMICEIESYWNAIVPVITTGGNCLILSTPCTAKRKADRWFRRMWKSAYKESLKGRIDFAAYHATCHEHPVFSPRRMDGSSSCKSGRRGVSMRVFGRMADERRRQTRKTSIHREAVLESSWPKTSHAGRGCFCSTT